MVGDFRSNGSDSTQNHYQCLPLSRPDPPQFIIVMEQIINTRSSYSHEDPEMVVSSTDRVFNRDETRNWLGTQL